MGRPQCTGCFRKHLSQAIVLMDESFNGYPIHRWIAMGHLAEAESEIRTLYPEAAKEVRQARLQIQDNKEFDPKKDPDLMKILYQMDCRLKNVNSAPNDGITNTRTYQFWEGDVSETNVDEHSESDIENIMKAAEQETPIECGKK